MTPDRSAGDRAQGGSEPTIGMMLLVLVIAGGIAASNVLMEIAPTGLESLAGLTGFLLGCVGVMVAVFAVVETLVVIADRYRGAPTTYGVVTRRDDEDVDEIDQCVWCDIEGAPGVETQVRKELVVAGFAVRTLAAPGAADCRACHDDAHRAAMRAEMDEPPPLRSDGAELSEQQRAFREFLDDLQDATAAAEEVSEA